MVEYILGNYLVNSGKVTRSQLESVVDNLDQVRVKLGLIAVAEGMMTQEQADEVNRLQSVMDKRFGDIAVAKGYLTDEQIGNLLKAQGNTYMAFVQAMVNEGILDMNELDTIFEGYREENGFSKNDMEMLKTDDPENVLPLFLTPETLKYQDIMGIAVRTFIRCIDRHTYIGKAYVTEGKEVTKAACQEVEGDEGYKAAFEEMGGGLLQMASVFAKEAFEQVDEDVLDAAGEFLNCINGLYVSAMSQKGQSLELMPPEYIEETAKVGNVACVLPVFVKDKQLNFIVTH